MQGKRADIAREARMRLLSAGGNSDDSAMIAQAVAVHVATCPVCTIDETALDTLIGQYRQLAQPPLPEDLERRLLNWLCAAHQE